MKLARHFGALLLCATASAQNVLILVADDLGVDGVRAYGEYLDEPRTPNLDALAASGVLFRNAWSYPSCSASRAAMLTGRHGFRTGIGFALPQGAPGLSLAEDTLPELMPGYASGLFGKWHLGGPGLPELTPNAAGWGYFAGMLWAGVPSYYAWTMVKNGASIPVATYSTTAITNQAAYWITQVAREPWVCQVAYNAPHRPWEYPPANLHSYPGGGGPLVQHFAMLEAMDAEIGRLLSYVDLCRTTVIFCGDNGTHGTVYQGPSPGAKLSPYEGGLNVPLILAGAGVVGPREELALVHLVDVFATTLDVAGVAVPAGSDSVSLLPYAGGPSVPLRSTVFTESFGAPSALWNFEAIRDARYKLVNYGLVEELYDLAVDPNETSNLMLGLLTPGQLIALEALRSEILAIKGG